MGWRTGTGLSSVELIDLVCRHRSEATVEELDDPIFWGRAIDDERYLLASRR